MGEPDPTKGTIVYRDSDGEKGIMPWGQPMPGGYSLNPPSYESYAGGVDVETEKVVVTGYPSLDEKFQPMKAESVFSGVLDVIKKTLEDSAVRLISQNKTVQEEVEKQKVIVGKEMLWKYIPFILIGTVLTVLIVRFK